MFNQSKKTHIFTKTLMAGAAGVLLSGSAAYADSYAGQRTMIQPQTAPVQIYQESTYTRTERPATHAAAAMDANHQAVHHGMHTATTTTQSAPKVAEVNPTGLRYMSGGVGADEQMRIEAAQSEYPVKMTFANTNGAYVSNVDVDVMNSAGEIVLGLQTDGPILLMDLEPGKYTVKANDNGEVKTQNITVSGVSKSYNVRFKTNEPQDYSMSVAE